MSDQSTMQDPRMEGAQPPFPKQEQPYPGFESEMDPKPDFGEDSYRGSGKLKDRVALITGADSPMGRPAQPAELAPAYVFLASPEASYVNGEIVGVTGGKPLS